MGLFDKYKKEQAEEQDVSNIHSSRIPFPAYHGNEPYIFISYAHLDAVKVFGEISEFHNNGYHVWYDEGIAPGNEWTDEIANALEKCALFVVFITPQSASSVNVQNEINFALDEKKPFLAIHLEETTLRAGIKLQIGTKQAILKYLMSQDEYIYKYSSAFERMGLTKGTSTQGYKANANNAPTTQAPLTKNEEDLINQDESTHDDFDWFDDKIQRYRGNSKKVVIPSKASAILTGAFSDNMQLEEVFIPVSVDNISTDAFINCLNLKKIVIDGGFVGGIGAPIIKKCPSAYIQCHQNSFTHEALVRKGHKNITFFPNEDEKQDYHATENFEQDDFIIEHGALKEYVGTSPIITLPNRAKVIGYTSFGDAQSFLEKVDLNQASALLDGAFEHCPKLKEVTIPLTVTMIMQKPFIDCPNLTVYCHKEHVLKLQEKFEENFGGKKIVYLDEDNNHTQPTADNTPSNDFEIEYGVLKKYHGNAVSVKVPKGVIEIATQAFSNCELLEHVELPDKLRTIRVSAFMSCRRLQTLNIPATVTYLYSAAFINCPLLVITCHKSSLEKTFEKTYSGMDIVYLDED